MGTVDDGGTQRLMNSFYSALQNGNRTQSEALRQVHIALGNQRGMIIVQRLRDTLKPEVASHLNPSYYWTPFM